MSAISTTQNRMASPRQHTPVGEISGIDRMENFIRLGAAHCDGALKLPGQPHHGLGFADGIGSLALHALRGKPAEVPALPTARQQELLRNAEKTALVFPAAAALLCLQPVAPRKLAVQWNLPSNIRRNCHDLLGGEQAEFLLRLYQKVPVASGWKAAHRTLEFPVDISRRRCFIKLEQADGTYSAELGVRLGDERYVFLARSAECTMPLPTPLPESRVLYTDLPGLASFAPECPTLFRNPDLTAEEFLSVRAAAFTAHPALTEAILRDWPERDCRAEKRVRAVYLDFLREGSRVFRSRGLILPATFAERRKEYFFRQECAQKTQADCSGTPVAPVESAPLSVERIDHAATTTDAASGAQDATTAYQPLAFPPACLNFGYDPLKLTRAQALRFAPLPVLCRRENLLAVESRTEEELRTKSGARRRVIHVKSASELAEAIRNAHRNKQAELILRGRVKPGRRVRVGGLLIETAPDGSFCVACMIRNGRLHVPVEEVSAISVE